MESCRPVLPHSPAPDISNIQLGTDHGEERRQNDELSELVSENISLREDVILWTRCVEQMREQQRTLYNYHEFQVRELSRETANLKADIVLKETHISAKQTEVNQLEERVDFLSANIVDLYSQNEALEIENSETKTEIEQLKLRYEQLQVRNLELVNENIIYKKDECWCWFDSFMPKQQTSELVGSEERIEFSFDPAASENPISEQQGMVGCFYSIYFVQPTCFCANSRSLCGLDVTLSDGGQEQLWVEDSWHSCPHCNCYDSVVEKLVHSFEAESFETDSTISELQGGVGCFYSIYFGQPTCYCRNSRCRCEDVCLRDGGHEQLWIEGGWHSSPDCNDYGNIQKCVHQFEAERLDEQSTDFHCCEDPSDLELYFSCEDSSDLDSYYSCEDSDDEVYTLCREEFSSDDRDWSSSLGAEDERSEELEDSFTSDDQNLSSSVVAENEKSKVLKDSFTSYDRDSAFSLEADVENSDGEVFPSSERNQLSVEFDQTVNEAKTANVASRGRYDFDTQTRQGSNRNDNVTRSGRVDGQGISSGLASNNSNQGQDDEAPVEIDQVESVRVRSRCCKIVRKVVRSLGWGLLYTATWAIVTYSGVLIGRYTTGMSMSSNPPF